MSQKKIGVIITYPGQLVHILTGFLYTPVMLRLLGQSEYGLYQLVNSVVSYLSLLSLGFGASYMRFYAREKAKKDDKGIAKLNGMFLLVFTALAVICLLCGFVMVYNIKGVFGNGLTETEYQTARVLMIFMVINLALTFPNSVFNCIVTSQEKFLFQKTLILLQYLLNPFLTLPALLMGYGSVGMVLITTLLTFGVLISNIVYCMKVIRTRFCFKNLNFSLFKEMWVFTFFIFLNQIIDQINWSVDKFLLGRLSGTAAVAIYGIGGQINSLYLQFSTAVSNVFVPEVNRIVAENGDDEQLTKLFTKIGRIQFIIMALILSEFIFFGKPFVSYWAGKGYEASYYVTLLLIIPVTVPLIQNIGIEIQRAKNMHKARSVVYFFIALLIVLFSIPLIKLFGPIGAAFGTTISLVLGNVIFMNWYYHFKIGMNIGYYWKNIAAFIPALICPVLLGCACAIFGNYNSVMKLLAGMAFYGVVYLICIYFLGLNDTEKEMLKSLRGVKNE